MKPEQKILKMMVLGALVAVSLAWLTATLVEAGPARHYENVRFENTLITTRHGGTLGLASGSGVIWVENRMRVNADLLVQGRVGVGTTDPGEALEVRGNIKLSARARIYGIPGWRLGNVTINSDNVELHDLFVYGPLDFESFVEQGLGENGYVRVAPGLLIQWGMVRSGLAGEGGFGPVSFPRTFSTAPAVVVSADIGSADNRMDFWLQVYGVTTSRFFVFQQADRPVPPALWNIPVHWIAIGT